MKRLFIILIAVLVTNNVLHAQSETTGSIVGHVLDSEMSDEPLPFTNIHIQGTSQDAKTDMEGLYSITNLEPGTYTVVFIFVGYEPLEISGVIVEPGKATEINAQLGASTASIDEVVINTGSRKALN